MLKPYDENKTQKKIVDLIGYMIVKSNLPLEQSKINPFKNC